MKTLAIMLCTALVLSGCQLTRVEGEVDDVEVKVSSKESSQSEGKFCPPGQAQKGKC